MKPEGYQLLMFKERVLRILDRGTLEHTVTAFWEYVLLMEVCSGIIKSDRKYHEYDHEITEAYIEIYNRYKKDELISEGDFAERLLRLIKKIDNKYSEYCGSGSGTSLSSSEITSLIFQHDIERIRNDISHYMRHKEGLWILIDNLDKGWPTHGLEDIDLVMIRCLLDASRKIERWMSRRGFECHTIIFLRNDVYELLVQETADRGKEFAISVDWQDPELLREIIRMRMIYSGHEEDNFFELWSQAFVSHIKALLHKSATH